MNTKMKEGAFVADHVNEFNLILSRLMSIDIKFDDEVQALLLLSLLPESWSGTLTTKGNFQNLYLKPVASKDKEVHMAIRDYDNALVYCIANTIDDRIMDSGASFHATYCKEELERGNVPLWHQRLGNMSENGMKILASMGRIPDLQKVVVGFCEPCVLGKQKKGFEFQKRNGKGRRDDTFNEDSLYGAKAATTSGEKDSKDDAFFEEGGFETPQVQRSTKESRALVRYSPSANYFLLTKNVGSVMYDMVCTRPDIVYAVGVISRFMSNPGRKHWEAVLLHYLKGTSKATLCFSRKEVVLEGFSDSDYEGCLDSGTSSFKKILRATNHADMLTKRYKKVRAITLLKGRRFEIYRDYLRQRAVKWSASK
uniref:Retrovirus-related Pol polyprotein from transposon TNT 1-94 n=1 Tax=Tanacetum cinerariifolium TaxID=118510 RepID=A0A699HQ56_TANCI|nr:retrovirus-related Pol polyprotein from transposon TNT 1-94 [Tanacetum cinerariifolium]